MKRTSALLLLLLAACRAGSHEHEPHDGPIEPGHEERRVEATSHGREVRIEQQALERMGIEIATVASSPLAGGLELPAEIQAEPDRVAHVSSVVSGQLARVDASIGDEVKKGQTLAVIRSVQLGEARAAAARARANVAVARSSFERQEELQKEGIGAKRHYLEAQAELRRAQAELSAADRALEVYGRGGSGAEVTIESPIAGRILERHATVGEVVGPTDVLFQVTDIGRVWVVGRAYQQQAGLVREKAPSTLTLQAYPGRSWQGLIDYVAPALDERTRTLAVRLVLDNPEGLLRPGLFGTLSLSPSGAEVDSVPMVRAGALQRVGEELVVFAPTEDEGRFRAVVVAVGGRSRGLVTIASGLRDGDRYVAAGGFVLKSELLRADLGEGHAH